MSQIKLPIHVGQKFLSNGVTGEILSVTRNNAIYPVVWMSDHKWQRVIGPSE